MSVFTRVSRPLAFFLLGSALAGCGNTPPPVEAPSPRSGPATSRHSQAFLDAWTSLGTTLGRFQEEALKPSPDVRHLNGIRDAVHEQVAELGRQGGSGTERVFLDLTSEDLDRIGLQVDEALRMFREGRADPARQATRRIGFILEEMAAFLKATEP